MRIGRFYRFYDLAQTAAQIAEAMQMNASTVRSRLMRGRKHFEKSLLKEDCFVKTSWDRLMRYAPEREYPLAPLQPDEAARIVEQTMQKAGSKRKNGAPHSGGSACGGHCGAFLCVSAFAAFRLGWFDRLFGGSAALVESKVTAYDETAQYDVTLPSYTEQEQSMIAEGTMQVPEQAEVAETGVSAGRTSLSSR